MPVSAIETTLYFVEGSSNRSSVLFYVKLLCELHMEWRITMSEIVQGEYCFTAVKCAIL